MTTETTSDVGSRHARRAAPPHSDGAVPVRHRVAAGLVAAVGVGVIIGTLLALDALHGYQVVLNVVGGGAAVGAAVVLWRGGGRALAVVLTWLAAAGVTCEAGDHQARINDTGALAATNTSYFLPGVIWVVIAVLFAAAIAVTALAKRVRGDA